MPTAERVDQPKRSSNVIPAAHVQIVRQPVACAAEHEAPPTPAAPRISVIEEGGVVRTIEIACTCGEVIRLECKY
jgi:hypothetical protein